MPPFGKGYAGYQSRVLLWLFSAHKNDQIIPVAQEKSSGIRLKEVSRLMTASSVSHVFLSVA